MTVDIVTRNLSPLTTSPRDSNRLIDRRFFGSVSPLLTRSPVAVLDLAAVPQRTETPPFTADGIPTSLGSGDSYSSDAFWATTTPDSDQTASLDTPDSEESEPKKRYTHSRISI